MTSGDVEVPEGWTLADDGKSIEVRLTTKDFGQAMDLVNRIAQVAEELDHHPDFHLTSWNRLRVVTYSHDVGRLTDRDSRLAERINGVLESRGVDPTS